VARAWASPVLPGGKRVVFTGAMLAIPLAGAVALAWYAHIRFARLPSGEALNRMAWEANFTERGLPVPPGGPRDGYWGARMPGQVKDPEMGWHEAEAHMPGLVEEDANGLQRLETPGAQAHLLIIGGSVAWGAYASSIETTYIAKLARTLAAHGYPVNVTVLAAGAWTSEHELKALRLRGLALAPDVVMIFDGLNDLTLGNASEDERVTAYLDRMREARDLARAQGASIVFALQPMLLDKRRTAIEERVLGLSLDTAGQARVTSGYERMRAGLRELAKADVVSFVDCSGAFDAERATTFTDLWHFPDPGHALLADRLAPAVLDVLRGKAWESTTRPGS
jgi:lysophospholipase L1-like esterase